MARALLLLALLAVAASTAAALSCGSTLTDVVLSGCQTCIEVNITRHGGDHHGPGLRKLLHRGGGDSAGFGVGGSKLVPSCTECNTGANFVLKTWNKTKSVSYCACADGFGTVVTANATILVHNKTRTVPVFSCVKCGNNEVPLGRQSNVRYTCNGTLELIDPSTTVDVSSLGSSFNHTSCHNHTGWNHTGGWSHNHTGWNHTGRSHNHTGWASRAGGSFSNTGVADGASAAHHIGGGSMDGGADGHWGHHGGREWGHHGGHMWGQCVTCPAGSATTDGITCVASA